MIIIVKEQGYLGGSFACCDVSNKKRLTKTHSVDAMEVEKHFEITIISDGGLRGGGRATEFQGKHLIHFLIKNGQNLGNILISQEFSRF